MNDVLMKVIFGILAAAIGTVSVFIFKGRQDNPVEEVAEMVLEEITGVDIDLTPTSKEK